jgi:hypothetical protein
MSPKRLVPGGALTWEQPESGGPVWQGDRLSGVAYGVQAVDGRMEIEKAPVREAGLWLRMIPATTVVAGSKAGTATVQYRLLVKRTQPPVQTGSWVSATVTDGAGKSIPCKARFNGRNGTRDPEFGPESGERLVRNLVYSENGTFRQKVPPGDYEVTVSRGPEYTIATVPLTVKPDTETPLRAVLERVVQTPGWVAANFANYTAGSSQMSDVSGKGRVLNLLAEGIEFAPSTDIETITDLQPAIRELGAESWLSTCPGVRLNWNGKYAQRTHTAFPLVYQRGKQDGGMLQRTQHVMTRSWLERWNPAGPKSIIIDEPWSDRIFLEDLDGDGKADVWAGAGNDVLDVHDLLPLAGVVAEGQDTRVLDLFEALRLGYLTKGIVNSGDLTTFHGNSRWRTYVRVPADDPALVKPAEVVESLSRGRMIMTSGPFLDVTLRAPGSGVQGGPGEKVKSADGRVEVTVSVQAPVWMQIDEVRILVNGEVNPALCFARSSQPERFKAAPKVFEAVVPLTLATDSYVVVTAFGTGLNLAPRGTESPERNVQVAAANRIWVDVGGDGYRPTPPLFGNYRVTLGGEKNVGAMWEIKPVSAKPGAGPGLIQMPVQNRTNETFSSTVSFSVWPAGSVVFGGGKERAFRAKEARYQAKPAELDAVRMVNNRLDYTLKPLQKLIVEFEVALAEGKHPGGFFLSVPRDEAKAVSMVGYYFEVYGYTCPVLKQTPALAQVADALKDLPAYSVTSGEGVPLGEVRFAVTRDQLALDVAVRDSGLPTGSVVRVYTTRNTKEAAEPYDPMYRVPRKLVICRTILAPGTAGVATTRAEAGYRTQTLLPLKALGIPQAGEGKLFLIEIEIESSGKDGRRHAGTVFGSTRPQTDNIMYGSINGNQVRVGHY